MHVATQFSYYLSLKKLSFFHEMFLTLMSKIIWPYVWKLVSVNSIQFYRFIHPNLWHYHCLDYHNFVVSSKYGGVKLQDALKFHMNFVIDFSIFLQKKKIIGIVIECITSICELFYIAFLNSSLTTHEYRLLFHFLFVFIFQLFVGFNRQPSYLLVYSLEF